MIAPGGVAIAGAKAGGGMNCGSTNVCPKGYQFMWPGDLSACVFDMS